LQALATLSQAIHVGLPESWLALDHCHRFEQAIAILQATVRH
jgi:hypothetical protein